MVGKNFAKDTKMIFQSQKMTGEVLWQEIVVPDKEYLQQVNSQLTVRVIKILIYLTTPLVDPLDLHDSAVRGQSHSGPGDGTTVRHGQRTQE